MFVKMFDWLALPHSSAPFANGLGKPLSKASSGQALEE
jgi:hypothetical protein